MATNTLIDLPPRIIEVADREESPPKSGEAPNLEECH